MTYRCVARVELDNGVLAMAKEIASPYSDIHWASLDAFQCVIEDVPHDHHAAFLRTGGRTDFDSDVFLCWRENSGKQWLEDIEVCLKPQRPNGSCCTIYQEHPGRCNWAYIDPQRVAAEAVTDQLAKDWGLWHLFAALSIRKTTR